MAAFMGNSGEHIVRIRAGIVGRQVLSAQLGVGSVVLLDLAGSDGNIAAYVRVECAWCLNTPTSVLVASEDERVVLAEHVSRLTGEVLSSVDVLEPTLELVVDFRNGVRLHAFPLYARHPDYENWVVRLPDGEVLSAGPLSKLHSARGDQP